MAVFFVGDVGRGLVVSLPVFKATVFVVMGAGLFDTAGGGRGREGREGREGKEGRERR